MDNTQKAECARIAHKVQVAYYINCVKKGLITADEYLEMSDLYLYPYYKWVKRQLSS